MNIKFYISFIIIVYFKIYQTSAIKCQKVSSISNDTIPDAHFQIHTIECSGLCYSFETAKVLKRSGCSEDNTFNMTNVNGPGCFQDYNGEKFYCLCNWDNCNILKGYKLYEAIVEYNNSSYRANLSIIIVTIILILILK